MEQVNCERCNIPLTYNNFNWKNKFCTNCFANMFNDVKNTSPFIIPEEDIINKPKHYHADGFDPISIGEQLLTKEEMQGFYKMNVLKYWYRAGKKDNNSKEQDLEKMKFYKNKLIEMEKEK